MVSKNKLKNLRERMIRQQSCCWYCGVSFKTTAATFEHILPRSRGGSWHKSNIRLACKECNEKKGDVPLEYIVMTVPSSSRQKPRMLFTWELESTETETMIRKKATQFEYDSIPEQHRVNTKAHAMKIHDTLNQRGGKLSISEIGSTSSKRNSASNSSKNG